MLFQTSISSSKWPAEDYEMMLAEKVNMTYGGVNITYDGSTLKQLELLGMNNTQSDSIKASIANNFLRVG